MKQNLRKSVITRSVLISQLISLVAVAQPASVTTTSASSQSQTSTTKVSAEKKETKAFTLSLGIEYSQKVAAEEKGERESSTDTTLVPIYRITESLNAGANVVFSKENSGARQSSVSNTQLILGIKGFKINSEIETLHSANGVIPTNEESKKRDRLQGALSIMNGLRLTKTSAKVDYKLTLSKNFHEFTVNAEDSPNIEYRMVNALTVTIPITDKLSFSTMGAYRLGQTYKGFQRSAFEIHADLNFDVLEQLMINLGTSNDGSALKANGVDSNIEAYNANTSVWRAGISLTI